MDALKVTLEVSAAVIILFTLIPLIRHDHWAFRVFEYPRLQKLFLNLVILIVYGSLYKIDTWMEVLTVAFLMANAGYLVFQIHRFTFLSKKMIIHAVNDDPDNQICIISSNVFQDNRDTQGCMNMLKKHDPDVILLLETDQYWFEGTKMLAQRYPYQVLVPQENTYGMLLYSKLELVEPEVRFLVDEEIPSIKTGLKLLSGKMLELYCVHPTPPVPGENTHSTERDKELLLVAKEVKASSKPSVVIGDLNDVAWSYTTELFTKVSGLLDPRVGRGFYNTFHAKLPFLRFPLDHVFCSTDFKLVRLKRLENFCSDHFPILISLQYEQLASLQQEEPQADEEELELAEEKIEKETD